MPPIPLTQGKFAIVDSADYAAVSQFKWYAQFQRGRWYAARRPAPGEKIQYLHQFILPGVSEIDHEDGDGLDCRRQNLRPVTRTQNNANRRKQKGTLSQYKGVTWHKQCGKWMAQIQYNHKHQGLGLYLSESEAAKVYDAKAREVFGMFARTNFPLCPS